MPRVNGGTDEGWSYPFMMQSHGSGKIDSCKSGLRRLCMRPFIAGLIIVTILAGGQSAAEPPSFAPAGKVIRVGPRHALTTVAAAARLAKDGDVVEIEAGDYIDDVASWPQSNLTIRAVGGRARMVSRGNSAEGKAIWVIKGHIVIVENVEFYGARVPARNGAGIRHEGGKLIIRNCLFEHNEMGLLTWNSASAELEIERSEFRHNAVAQTYKPGDRIGHQIYVGTIGRFLIRESYVHHGAFGHLVKSRARENYIYNNRFTDEHDGRASYELEFPNGGIAYVVGNIIQQSAHTENWTLVSFGAEGYKWPRNELYLVNNTLVDDLPTKGAILTVVPGADRIEAANNLILGNSRLETVAVGDYVANYSAVEEETIGDRRDYRLRRTSELIGKAADRGEAAGVALAPEREYVHPLQSKPIIGVPRNPGAIQSVAH